MREFQESDRSLEGALLVAHPSLLEANFRRTVVFLACHNDDGTLGFVINRPTDKRVRDLLPDKDEMGALGDVPVYLGGPVGQNQLVIAAFHWKPEGEAIGCEHSVSIERASDLMHESQSLVRAFVGHAGWAKGQLESELASSAWIVEQAAHEMLEPKRCGGLWRGIMRGLGPQFRLEADAPDDPSQN